METQRTGKDDGGRDRPHGDSLQVSLEDDEELNKELNELGSFGMGKEAVTYRQASFFDAEFGTDLQNHIGKRNITFHTGTISCSC